MTWWRRMSTTYCCRSVHDVVKESVLRVLEESVHDVSVLRVVEENVHRVVKEGALHVVEECPLRGGGVSTTWCRRVSSAW